MSDEQPNKLSEVKSTRPQTVRDRGIVIFVFGSNQAGYHGAGAARDAVTYYGAIMGKGCGPQGNSYAIPTKDRELKPLSLDEIYHEVQHFIDWAKANRQHAFKVTRIGCGLAGYSDTQIAPMFANAPTTCIFDSRWGKLLPGYSTFEFEPESSIFTSTRE